MRDKDPPPEEFRCKRTDGRQWRCKRRAMDGKTLCDIHYLQGKHRQHKQKVPESLKLERNATKKRKDKDSSNGECSRVIPKLAKKPTVAAERRRRRGVSEALDEALKKMNFKRGDLHLELIRMFLKRQVEKKKEREFKESAAAPVADETRVLPYGVMAISQSHCNLQSVQENDVLDVKVGGVSNADSLLQRHFRSKNIEPLPISTVQVFPLTGNVKAKKIKKCHWCRGSKCRCLIKCLTCKKRFFCLECIKERYFEKQEVKAECPACRGICGCKLCLKQKIRPATHKESYGGGRKLDRKQLLLYLVYMLFPLLKKVNRDQKIELEKESTAAGKEQSEIQIPQTKLGTNTSFCCSKCKTMIIDYHRTCTKCSYNLCLSCCQDVSQRSSSGSFMLKSCKKRKISGDVKQIISRHNSRRPPNQSVISSQNWETSENGSISCPPTDIGGCGGSLLDLRCIYPFNWTRDLEDKAEDILDSYNLPTTDTSECCSKCNNFDEKYSELKPQKEPSKKIGYNNYLYSPTLKDLHQETLEHFQSHWGRGHPVIVRNVLKSNSGLCWDPVIMFCLYMEMKSSGSCDEGGMKATNCLDWCEVEINRKRIFMGSLEKRTHASIQQKVLKFKAWLSSHLFQKHFPLHYNEILSALPLPEYVSPVSGLLNVSLKLPKDLPKHDLGPCIYFSYGGPEELMQADYLSKLCYESHDTVNILAYATDAPISPEQIDKIEKLMKKYKTRDNHLAQSLSNSSDQKGKTSLQSEDTGESGLQDVGEKIMPPDGIENVPFYSSDPLKGQASHGENGNLSDDSEYDNEASILCCGSYENSEDSNENFQEEDIQSSCSSEDKQATDCCGAQWDIFSRQDAPKLLEYLIRHSNELTPARNYPKHVHPVLDQNFFLDAYHKLRLKEEYDIQPWTFEQCPGEAVFIPAGCPYQIRKIKSCVNIVVDFISPENATHCIQLNDEIRLLPSRHKAKRRVMEVEKMALQSISAAVEDLCNLAVNQIKGDDIPVILAAHFTLLE